MLAWLYLHKHTPEVFLTSRWFGVFCEDPVTDASCCVCCSHVTSVSVGHVTALRRGVSRMRDLCHSCVGLYMAAVFIGYF